MQFNRVYPLYDTTEPRLTQVTEFFMWYPSESPDWIPGISQARAEICVNKLLALPPGKRMVHVRWVLMYESGAGWPGYADPVEYFASNGPSLFRNLRYLRPLGQEMRKRGVVPDGIFADSEGGFNTWNLSRDQLRTIFRDKRVRRNMPTSVQRISPEQLDSNTNPSWREPVTAFNTWALQIQARALRSIMVDSGIFNFRSGGAKMSRPPIMNYTYVNPTFPVFDYNGWRWLNLPIDGRTSCPSVYVSYGARHAWKVHDPRWNALIDHVNLLRSCAARPASLVWPIFSWPTATNAWVWKEMIAHAVRTGINAANGCGYIYFNEAGAGRDADDRIVADTFDANDQPFPMQRGLPEVPLDSDSIQTAGYTTRYEDFLANVPPLSDAQLAQTYPSGHSPFR